MESTSRFYNDLPEHPSFDNAFDFSNYHDLPQGWFIVIVDIINSTKAIEVGHYKQVNTVGASAIMAVVNLDPSIEIPSTFGGDGATLAIPQKIEPRIREALAAIIKMARSEFGLELRTAIIPVEYLNRNGFSTRIKKITLSSSMSQAALFGEGWKQAETLIKSEAGKQFTIEETDPTKIEIDLSGLVCHWSEIESRNDHKICVLVQAVPNEPWQQAIAYKNVTLQIKKIYGDIADHHPLSIDSINGSLDLLVNLTEAKIRKNHKLFQQWIHTLKTMTISFIESLPFRKNEKDRAFKKEIIENCDFRKFDGMFRMVLDGTERQKNEIEKYLEEKFKEGKLVYGIHTSKKALMTCLIFSRELKKHSHFIDGADGGYALAAQDLKKRLKSLEQQKTDHSKHLAVVTAPPSGLR